MIGIILFLLFAAGLLVWQWYRERRRAEAAHDLAVVLAGHARAADTPFELLQQAGGGGPVLIASGGDNSEGVFDNKGICPCRHTYTVATRIIPINVWPNPKPNPVAGFPWNAPPRAREPWDCPGNCVVVPTKIWRGWRVYKLANGTFQMNINTFTQYHCKEPGDPDVNKIPEGSELPPKPGDVNP